jgi:hypothetical protein
MTFNLLLSFPLTYFKGVSLQFASPTGLIVIVKRESMVVNSKHNLPDQLKEVLEDPHIVKVIG